MDINAHNKRALAAAFREAGEYSDEVTIHHGTGTITLPAVADPTAPANLRPGTIGRGDTALHTPISGWKQANIHTQQDYRRFRCEKYARRALRLPEK